MQLTPIDEASLERMSEAKLAELLQAHEALYRAKCRDEIVTYVSSIELPGAPPALTEKDKKRLAEKKSHLRRSIRRDTSAFWEEEEFGGDSDTLTSRKVDVAQHHALILEAIKGTVDEVPIHGPLANGMDGAIADGVMIFCPPGAAKSTYASVAAPSYLLGLYSNFDIIGASYASELAKRFGRRVRQVCRDKTWQKIFETELSEDNQAVDQWSLKNGSSYRSVGIMGGVTGFRSDVLIIDDPVAGREEADSDIIREKTWQAFKDDLLTRLKPGGKVVVIQCMTGDTQVMMADGSWKAMVDVRVGDRIATYDNYKLTSSVVKGFSSQGVDRIYEIRMKSGRRVRANARHPFLAVIEGVQTWQTTASLAPGSIILAAKSGGAPAVASAEFGVVPPASTMDATKRSKLEVTAKNTTSACAGQGRSKAQTRAANTMEPPAPLRVATSQQNAGACATFITESLIGRLDIDRLASILSRGARRICGTVTALIKRATTSCSKNKMDAAQSVASRPQKQTPVLIGRGNYASTTVMTLERLGAYSATTATSLSDTARRQIYSTPQLDTYEIEEDEVVEIVDAGTEEVFDLQVEGTENFIASGLVSHNTRWHEDDLSGRILGEKWGGQSGLWRGTDGRLWLVLCLPMVSIHDDDPLGRAKGEILWAKKPDGTGWFTERHVELAKTTGERSWGALYQQQPSASDGNIILKRHFRCWPHGQPDMTPEQEQNYAAETPPKDIEYVFLTYDTAFEDDEEADYSAMTAWGAFRRTVRTGRKGNDEAKQWNIIMLGAWRAKVDAVDLARMIEEHIKLFKPNEVLIEKRASGIQLLQELRRKRFRHEYGQVAITAWLPPGPQGSKGKRPRAYQSALIMDAGCVWYMPGPKTKAVIKECLAFPNGTYKDWVDCTTMAVLRSRNDFILEVPRDELDDEEQHELEREQLERGRRRGYADTRLKKEGVLVSRPEKGELARRRLYGGM